MEHEPYFLRVIESKKKSTERSRSQLTIMEHSCLIKSGYRLVSLPRLQHILRKSRGTSDYKMFSCSVWHFWVINQFFCQFQLSLFSFQRQINKGKVLLSVLTEGSPIMGDTEKIKVWKRALHSITFAGNNIPNKFFCSVCDRGRWCCGENMSPHILLNQQVSYGIRSDGDHLIIFHWNHMFPWICKFSLYLQSCCTALHPIVDHFLILCQNL